MQHEQLKNDCVLSSHNKQILGVSNSATEKEIKAAYRKKALKLHPDVNKEPGAEEKFMRCKEAYAVCSSFSP